MKSGASRLRFRFFSRCVDPAALLTQAMRLDNAGQDADDDQHDQGDRQGDAPRQRLDHTVTAAFVGEHVVQAGAEVVDDRDQENDDKNLAQHVESFHATQGIPAQSSEYSGGMSGHWRRPGWFAITLVVLGTAAFLWLGFWQLRRAEEKQRLFGAYALAAAGTPVSLAEARRDDTPQRYPRIATMGRYDTQHVYLLDNQTREGRAGVIVWVPFQPDDGGPVVLVDLGFLPQPDPRIKPQPPQLAEQPTMLNGLYAPPPGIGLRLGGNALLQQTSWPKLTIRIDLEEIAKDLDRVVDSRVILADVDPASGLERHWTPEVMVPNKHRAYALQWFSFAIAAVILFVVVHRRRDQKKPKHEPS